MKIVFMGTPAFAATILKDLAKHHEIVALCTKEPKKIGRKQVLQPSQVEKLANNMLKNTAIFTPKTLKDEALEASLAALKPDFIIVAAYGKLLPANILKIAPCINIHASLLPKYRGASPIQEAILRGDEQSGLSTMLMDSGLDSGDILLQESVDIRGLNADELFKIFAKIGSDLLLRTIKDFASITPKPQDESLASKCGLIKKEHGLISFDDASSIYRRYLAFHSWPGVYLKTNLKLIELELESIEGSYESGEVLAILKDHILIGCKKGSLRLKTLQAAGKKPLPASSFANGRRLKIADILS